MLLRRETRTIGSFGQATIAAVVVLAMNYWWIVPLVTLRGTWGGSPAFFKNPNVWERLGDLFRVEESAPLLAAPSLMGVLLILTASQRQAIRTARSRDGDLDFPACVSGRRTEELIVPASRT